MASMTFNAGDFVIAETCGCGSEECYPSKRIGVFVKYSKLEHGDVDTLTINYGNVGTFEMKVVETIRLATEDEKAKALFFYSLTGKYNND
jgi:hypothetical protein